LHRKKNLLRKQFWNSCKMKKYLLYSLLFFCIACSTKNTQYKGYYPDGKLQIQVDYGKDTSNYYKTVFWENGNKQWEANFIGDKESGIYKEYYENGKIKFKADFVNGVQQGLYKKYYEDGKLEEKVWVINGKSVGIDKQYFQNGILQRELGFVDGVQQGLGKVYYENGKLQIAGEFINGIQQGRYKEYYENGKIKDDGLYADDHAVYYKQYNEQGKVISEYHKFKIIPIKDTINFGEIFKANMVLYGNLGDKKLEMIIGQVSDKQHILNIKDFKANNILKNQQAYYEFKPLKEGKYVLAAGAIIPGAADSVITDELVFVVLPATASKK